MPTSRRAWLQAASAAVALRALGGCTLNPDQDHNGPHAPHQAPLDRPPGVAWVFSSGGPRGFVHVGSKRWPSWVCGPISSWAPRPAHWWAACWQQA
jgi:hypothetical protein